MPDLTLRTVWDECTKIPSKNSDARHKKLITYLHRFDANAKEGILNELLQIEADSLRQDSRLHYIREKIMDLVDRKVSAGYLRRMIKSNKNQGSNTEKSREREKSLEHALADCEIQITILKAYIHGKYGDAIKNNWLDPDLPLPDDKDLATHLCSRKDDNLQPSLVEPYRDEVLAWSKDGIQGTTIHAALVRKYNFQGSYSSVRRFLAQFKTDHPEITTILNFDPGDAAQVDFGKGPTIIDVFTGEIISTWFFVMTLAYSRHQYAEIVGNGIEIATQLGHISGTLLDTDDVGMTGQGLHGGNGKVDMGKLGHIVQQDGYGGCIGQRAIVLL